METYEILTQSTSNERYTPSCYIEAARRVMGGIDLDPASCDMANRTVQAGRYYTEADNGLALPWAGRVWLNPPYGRSAGWKSNKMLWTRKALEEYLAGKIEQIVILVTASTGDAWFQPFWNFSICFPDHRINFVDEYGNVLKSGNTGSSAFFYLGQQTAAFWHEFSPFGRVIPPERNQVAAHPQLEIFELNERTA